MCALAGEHTHYLAHTLFLAREQFHRFENLRATASLQDRITMRYYAGYGLCLEILPISNVLADKAEEGFIKSALSDHQQHLDFTLPYDNCIKQLSMRSRVNHDELWKSSKAVRAIEELRSQLKN